MSSRLLRVFEFLFKIERRERLKLLLLTTSFFFVIGGYTIIKELKDSVFMSTVGIDYQPIAKVISMIVLVPAIIFYSYLVDRLRRYQLLYFYSLAYAILGLIFAYFIAHPSIGIANTDTSPYRIFGWLFYFFVEGYSPFVVSVFWAFANSITSPEAAKTNYGLMVSGSKIGGMFTAAFAWYLFSCKPTSFFGLSTIVKHQILLGTSSFLLLFVPFIILFLIRKVPGQYLHGYEAVYKVEKEKSKEELDNSSSFNKNIINNSILNKIKTFFTKCFRSLHVGSSGLKMVIRQPYVFAIFGIIFFYELINVVLGYQRLLLAKGASADISELNCVLFKQVLLIHFFGFLLSFLGTNTLLRLLGERRCLLLLPLLVAFLLLFFMISGTLDAITTVFIGLRVLNYAISYPLRESLYIPTIKEIKFKSKSWIDSFGSKLAKGFGSSFNIFAKNVVLGNFGMIAFVGVHYIFFGLIIGMWFVTSYYLGKKYQKSIDNNEVIGFS